MMKPEPSAVARCGALGDWSRPPNCSPKRSKNSSKGEPSGKPKGMPCCPRGACTSWVEAMFTTAGLTFLARSEKPSGAVAAAATPLPPPHADDRERVVSGTRVEVDVVTVY